MIIDNPSDLPEGSLFEDNRSDWYIYFLWFRGELVYIGQSVNLLSRIASHRSCKNFDRYTYHLIKNTTKSEVLAIERANINHYRPAYNDNTSGVIKRPKWCIQGKATDNNDLYMKGKLYESKSGHIFNFYDGEFLHTYFVHPDHVIHEKDGKRFEKLEVKKNQLVYFQLIGEECVLRFKPKPFIPAPSKATPMINDEVLHYSTVLKFGKYKGENMGFVLNNDKPYALWIAKEAWKGPIHSKIKSDLRMT